MKDLPDIVAGNLVSAIVPVAMFEALMAVMPAPLPESVPVMVVAETASALTVPLNFGLLA
ncbi:hypothetical protein ASF29_23260 [Rhizobium sp. Leaf262]|nr:hypothetical protein ASF29_23260 [Rhizobium sp. Leaf262]